MTDSKLFSSYKLGKIELKNHIVMAPMTRSRALNNIPNELMAEYYAQRSGAGLIITEGTSPSPNGLGYTRMPGIFSSEQIKGWERVTKAVHAKGGKIFLQMMHTGRIGHKNNLPDGARVLAPSAVKAGGQMWTDSEGMQDYPVPEAFTKEELAKTKAEFIQSSINAVEAGFDGVELHGANGYLLEQFLSPHTNQRTDEYGGSIQNRCRFVVETAKDVANAIGAERTAIRLSPYGANCDMKPYPEIHDTYAYLAEELDKIGLVYIHIADHSAMGAPEVPRDIKQEIRNRFKNTIILSGGYNKETAAEELGKGIADVVAFGRPFINNPDLVERFINGWPLSSELNFDAFYTPDEKGYIDYPAYK
ncbi:MAG: alkene reductase [Bacteroidetes bacterium]|nr:alkene reductase [Bacteroidota bacterium]